MNLGYKNNNGNIVGSIMDTQGPYLPRTAPVVEGATKDYRDFADLLEKFNEIL